MHIGTVLVPPSGTPNVIDYLVNESRQAAGTGVGTVWLPQLMAVDALTAVAAIAREVAGIEFGTAVVPTYPRHPLVLASQALTAQAASGNRLTLGVGLSHQMVIEGAYGYSFERPVRHMREYLSILMPALRGESVSFEGETMRGTTFEPVTVGGASAPEVLVAALGPAMLELAGQMAGGTVTWMVGPRTLSSHIIPSITAASEAAGRVAPRIAVCLPVCVTSDPDRALQRAARSFALYNQLPSYRAMLDREDVDGPGDVALIGEEDRVAAAVEQLKEIGATDFAAVPLGPRDEWQRTAALMSDLAGRL